MQECSILWGRCGVDGIVRCRGDLARAVSLARVPLQAQGLGIKVQPSTIEERLDPGGSVEGVLTITNESDAPQVYKIGTRDVTGMELSGRPNFSDKPGGEDPYAASAWVRPQKDSVPLAAWEAVEVPYRIEVPTDASPGGYFAAIFVTREADGIAESGASVGFHVAALVNLRVNGEVREDLVLKEFSTGRAVHTDLEVEFTARMENTGTVHERPVGIITIADMFGKEAGKVMLNENEGAILPRSERLFDTTWKGEGFHVGRYTALLSVTYGNDAKQTVTRSTTFWIVPLRDTAAFAGAIVVALALILLGMRAYVRRQLRRAGYDAQTVRIREQSSFAAKLSRVLVWLAALLALMVVAVVVFFA